MPRRTLAVAAYLFWNRGVWVARDDLRSAFWPDTSPSVSTKELGAVLETLERELGGESGEGYVRDDADGEGGIVLAEEGRVRVNPAVECRIDARSFEAKAERGLSDEGNDIAALVTAVDLYSGDFFGENCCEVGCGTGWCVEERERLRDLYRCALRSLVDRLASSDFRHAALEYADRWREADPASEEASRWLMWLYGAMGQPARVTEEFDRCRGVLDERLGVKPASETVDAHKTLSRGARRARAQMPPAAPIHSEALAASEPPRSAAFLLAYGKNKLERGQVEEGLSAFEEALAIYETLDDAEGAACVHLAFAGALVALPGTARFADVGEHAEAALAHLRPHGPAVELGRALLVASEVYREGGQCDSAFEAAEECLVVARETGAQGLRAGAILAGAIALLFQCRLSEARRAFDDLPRESTALMQPRERLAAVFYRGALATAEGDLTAGEGFLREALATARQLPPSVGTDEMRRMICGGLALLLRVQERHEETEAVCSHLEEAGAGTYDTSGIHALILRRVASVPTVRKAEAWLRVRLPKLPRWWRDACSGLLIESMLEAGLCEDAAGWAALAARHGHAQGARLDEAYALCRRAIALGRLCDVDGARQCRDQALALSTERECRWIPARIAHVQGLIALNGERDWRAAERWMETSARLLSEIGAARLMRVVEHDLALCRQADERSRGSDVPAPPTAP